MPPKVEFLLPAHQILPECATPPDPPTGSATLYLYQGDGKLWIKKPNGNTVNLESSGGGAWGDITGTLADQTDLQGALDAKAASSHTHSIANVTSLQAALDGKCAGDDPRLSDARTPLTHSITSAHNGFPGGTSTFLRADGAFAAPPGGGGSANVGTTIINFGAFPGGSDASIAVTGQGAIQSGSVVQAWLFPSATADHTADEHMLETIKVFAGNVIAGTGFTIYAVNDGKINEDEPPQFYEHGQPLTGAARASRHPATYSKGKGTRIYGQWSVAWSWA